MGSLHQPPSAHQLESVPCYECSDPASEPFIVGQDDLTGNPGDFQFVRCKSCGLAYQSPRIRVEHIVDWYDDEYISHRRKTDWGILKPLYLWAMGKHDRDKDRLVSRYIQLDSASKVLDVGCGAGTFLERIHERYDSQLFGVDFKDLTDLPSFEHFEFHQGLFYEQQLPASSFDLITMWHFLEHDYDPIRTLEFARSLLAEEGKLVIEVPRLDSLSFRLYQERWPGLQAPQHTVLFDKLHLLEFVEKAGLEVVEYLPYGAFPPYFYLFTGAAFKILKGKGLNLNKAIYPYFAGQLLLSPILLFERHLNLAMQTVICQRKKEVVT